jgi:hypothetical protein
MISVILFPRRQHDLLDGRPGQWRKRILGGSFSGEPHGALLRVHPIRRFRGRPDPPGGRRRSKPRGYCRVPSPAFRVRGVRAEDRRAADQRRGRKERPKPGRPAVSDFSLLVPGTMLSQQILDFFCTPPSNMPCVPPLTRVISQSNPSVWQRIPGADPAPSNTESSCFPWRQFGNTPWKNVCMLEEFAQDHKV